MDGSFGGVLGFLLIVVLRVTAYYGIPTIYKKNSKVFELDYRYYNINDLRNATVEHLRAEGKRCEILDSRTLLIDGKKYLLFDRNLNWGLVPVQQVVLKRRK
ncbi:hypothetical protein [Clostridium sp. LIBA-8841]|uniref:hypothetical protein n=1 Tax=Clostridium sp. LIBA-8841 TaxID=2987530 RepID=UPI002AC5F057|nr:hypothetical protein [Clostridium sp. LIBA-8841]MDZ5252189.1 hypothetical protein [Clostridium sp. LIBA-8841]